MKKFLKGLLPLALAATMFAGCAGGSQGTAEGGETTGTETSGETIKIGTIYAMSGDKAAIGENILRGIDFAVEEINKQGGINGRMLEVVRGDHAGDAATGRSEAERLITQEHVDVMMGCHMSTVTEVVAQVCQQYGVPMITAISTLDKLSDEEHAAYDYFFRLCPLNSVYVEDMLKYLKDSSQQTGEEIKTVAIFTDKAAIGQELIRCVNLFADQYGLEVVGEVDYSGGAADLSAQVLALKQLNPDAILCDSYVNDAVLFVNTLKEQNYKPKMIVAKANGFTDPSFITQLGSAANGVASVVEFNSDLTNGAEINKEFKEVYDKIHAAYPYLSNGFIRSVYDLKETIAREYPLNEKIIILHRTSFNNVENLRQYVEITLKHGYMINADEKKMIVDAFRQHINTDGKIITSIFEVANQSALLSGEYEGYRVLFEDDL